jgi:hypothetical protein
MTLNQQEVTTATVEETPSWAIVSDADADHGIFVSGGTF